MVVMMSIPFGVVGAVIGHLIMGYDMSLIGMIGIVALSGVVINDSLVMLDFINRMRAKHASVHDAVVAAGVQRFRPIMLTTLTTVLGMSPLLYEQSQQAQFLMPTVITLVYGLGFGMLLVLLVVPALIAAQHDVSRHITAMRRGVGAHASIL